MRDRLDALVAVGDDDPHSPLHRINAPERCPTIFRWRGVGVRRGRRWKSPEADLRQRKYIGTRRKTFSLLLLVEGFSRRGV